jgi:hypothetical protein
MSFFDDVDRLVAKSEQEFAHARAVLKDAGWILRPVSGGGMWRARRWTQKVGTQRLYATTAAELIALAMADRQEREGKRVSRMARAEEVRREP